LNTLEKFRKSGTLLTNKLILSMFDIKDGLLLGEKIKKDIRRSAKVFQKTNKQI
jgi:hypothetical protein